MERLDYIARHDARLTVSGAPAGYDAYLAVEAARRRSAPVLFVAADETQADAALHAMAFFAPDVKLLSFPSWDCLPYDRVSPKPDIESTRLATLAALAKGVQACVVVTSVNAVLQRVPPKAAIAIASFQAKVGEEVDRDGLVKPKAFVTLRQPPDDATALIAALQSHVKDRIGVWKYPRWIEFIDSLPKTATGKIQRFRLRET